MIKNIVVYIVVTLYLFCRWRHLQVVQADVPIGGRGPKGTSTPRAETHHRECAIWICTRTSQFAGSPRCFWRPVSDIMSTKTTSDTLIARYTDPCYGIRQVYPSAERPLPEGKEISLEYMAIVSAVLHLADVR